MAQPKPLRKRGDSETDELGGLDNPFFFLLIEDNLNDVRLLRHFLRESPRNTFDLHHEISVKAAVKECSGLHFDLILLDLSLPDAMGVEAIQKVQMEFPDTPIVVYSGNSDEQLAMKAVRQGAQDYLLKEEINSHLLWRTLSYSVERAKILKDLVDSRERVAIAVECANDGIWDWNCRQEKVYFSPQWLRLLGFSPESEETSIDFWFELVHPEDLPELKRALNGNSGGNIFSKEVRLRHKEGDWRWFLVRGKLFPMETGAVRRCAGTIADVNDRVDREEKLRIEALYDNLTKIPNRGFFIQRLNSVLSKLNRSSDTQFAVLFIDLDRFKVINDSLGHDYGDKLLVDYVNRISSVLRPEDTVARLGGDEFAVLLEGVAGIRVVTHVAQRILNCSDSPFFIEKKKIYCTASIGIKFCDSSSGGVEDIIRDADIAMYSAKSKGKACYRIYDNQMHRKALDLMEMESDLQQAIRNYEFELHYQPIASISTLAIQGFEALLRWKHPEKGIILPADFIPIAEETGLICELGRWAMVQSLKDKMSWVKAGYPDLHVALNISKRQLLEKGFAEEFKRVMDESGTDIKGINMEITETTVMADAKESVEILQQLEMMGLRMSIDDFGTGSSSLGSLKKFPIKYLKIDKSFVQEIKTVADNSPIIKAILAMAHSLNLEVIAEGVETKEQLGLLRSQDCDFFQGFLLSQAVPNSEVIPMLKAYEKGAPLQKNQPIGK